MEYEYVSRPGGGIGGRCAPGGWAAALRRRAAAEDVMAVEGAELACVLGSFVCRGGAGAGGAAAEMKAGGDETLHSCGFCLSDIPTR